MERKAWLSAVATLALVVGAIGSFVLMRRIGHDAPMFLLMLFTGWVELPFVVLSWAGARATRWPGAAGDLLHLTAILVAAGSLIIYGIAAVRPPNLSPAALYLLVPLGSLVVVAVAYSVAARRARRSSQ